MKYFLIAIILLLTASTPLNAQHKGYFTMAGREVDIRAFDEDIDRMMHDIGIPGLSLAAFENGRIVYFNAYGVRQSDKKRKVNKSTLFEACSLSKTFLVFIAHQLVDEGKLDLDKPLYQYLRYDLLEHDPRYKLITARMILSHSSGIENWMALNNKDTLEIVSDPGTRFVYSGEGYNYLAKVIAVILKQPYEQYVAERIIQPFHLERTYLRFTRNPGKLFQKESPGNYAFGHNSFGEKFDKWKNFEPLPAAGCNLIAKDYARLILAIFDPQHLSPRRIADLLTPTIREEEDTSVYFGLGFELLRNKDDTIIAQSGSNFGYKANFFYSVVHRRGFVFFTNSDMGKLMTRKICEMTARLDIEESFRNYYFEQYPNTAIDLFKIYREQNSTAMFLELQRAEAENKININTLNELGDEFMHQDRTISKRLLCENIRLYPESALSFQLLGNVYLLTGQFDSAYDKLSMAKKLKPELDDIDNDLKKCKRRMDDALKRTSYMVTLNRDSVSIVQAENYCLMRGVHLERTSDLAGGLDVGHLGAGDWMDYKITVPRTGRYSITLRVASGSDGGRFELRHDSTVLTNVHVSSTRGWQKWTTLTTSSDLPAGPLTIRLYATSGGFSINWLKFSPITSNGKL